MCKDIKIAGWIKSSFIDYPGTVSTVLFLSGCNLRCPFCHNPSIVRDELPEISFSEIMFYLYKRKGIVDGVVITGGEPTIYSNLPDLVKKLRNIGVRVKVDTNGLEPKVVESCSADYLAMDIKAVPSRYSLLGAGYCDVEQRLKASIKLVEKMGSDGEVRIPVVPGIIENDDIDELIDLLKGVNKVFLQPFKNDAELLDRSLTRLEAFPLETVQQWCDQFRRASVNCFIRGQEY